MKCPECGSFEIKKNGTYKTGYSYIQKYKCKSCDHFYIENSHKYEKKPDLNLQILELYKQGLSRRKIADKLECAKRTVDLRLKKILATLEEEKKK